MEKEIESWGVGKRVGIRWFRPEDASLFSPHFYFCLPFSSPGVAINAKIYLNKIYSTKGSYHQVGSTANLYVKLSSPEAIT